MSAVPPAFEEASSCNGCKKAFGLLKRRHHCRNCGKSFCGDCQTKTMPLPAFGLTDPQRVCEPCAAQLTATPKAKAPVSPPTSNPSPAAAAAGGAVPAGMSTPAMRAGGGAAAAAAAPVDKKEAPVNAAAAAPAKAPPKRVKQCKCNMPLCICPDDPQEKDDKPNAPAAAAPQNKPAPKPAAASGAAGGGNSTFFAAPKQSGFSGFGQKTAGEYDLHGDLNEQCREAIKANDLAGVTKLLKAGASATYRDRTGATLLHMAAMFDRQAMVSLLVKAGADINAKNAHGETPVDLAPPSLGAKMAARKLDA